MSMLKDKYIVSYGTYERVHIQSATYTNLFPSFSSCGSVLFYSLLTMVLCHSAHDVVSLGATGSWSNLILTHEGYGIHGDYDILHTYVRAWPCTWVTELRSLTPHITYACFEKRKWLFSSANGLIVSGHSQCELRQIQCKIWYIWESAYSITPP